MGCFSGTVFCDCVPSAVDPSGTRYKYVFIRVVCPVNYDYRVMSLNLDTPSELKGLRCNESSTSSLLVSQSSTWSSLLSPIPDHVCL